MLRDDGCGVGSSSLCCVIFGQASKEKRDTVCNREVSEATRKTVSSENKINKKADKYQ